MISRKKLTKKTFNFLAALATQTHQCHNLELVKKGEVFKNADASEGFLAKYGYSLTNFLDYHYQIIANEIAGCLSQREGFLEADLHDIVKYYYPFFQIEFDLKSVTLFTKIIQELTDKNEIPLDNHTLGVFFSAIYHLLELLDNPKNSTTKNEYIVRLASAIRILILAAKSQQ